MKAKPTTFREGPEAAQAFDQEVRFLLSVPRAEMLKREAEYRKQVDANPNRPGPKRKKKVKS